MNKRNVALVRGRYLRAKRDFLYSEQNKEKAKKKIEKPTEQSSEKIETNIVACEKCGVTFSDKRGLSSHIRNNSCKDT